MITDHRNGTIQSDGGTLGVHTHTQETAAQVWTINHNLGFRPSVKLYTTGGVEYLADVTHLNANQVQVNHKTARAGTARCC